MVKLLIEHGADPEAINGSGHNAAGFAYRCNEIAIWSYLQKVKDQKDADLARSQLITKALN